ncbi:MAG: hypothetical protein H9W81_18415 [Enterococcus sp.]|nr:hypothetical protein [Enterococcus sp.]
MNKLDEIQNEVHQKLQPYLKGWLDIQLEREFITDAERDLDYEYSFYDKDYVIFTAGNVVDDDGVMAQGKVIRVPFEFIENPKHYFDRLERDRKQKAEWNKKMSTVHQQREREEKLEMKKQLEEQLAELNAELSE